LRVFLPYTGSRPSAFLILMQAQTFTKEERLRGKTVFTRLFSQGRSFNVPPFRITWQLLPAGSRKGDLIQAAFVVPKRNFKKATARNLLRRRMKEAYRIHKEDLRIQLTEKGKMLIFVCVYNSKEPFLFSEIESKIIVTLQRLAKETTPTVLPPKGDLS
jgi:ribonuclease P protein component